jgi:hypothetical protein
MKRKTIRVEEIKKAANNMLANSKDEFVNERQAVARFVSNLFLENNCYRGFNYLPSESDIHAGGYGKDGRVFFY